MNKTKGLPMAFMVGIIFSLAGSFLLPACKKHSSEPVNSPAAAKTLYHCAMHPQIVSDRPGECPICHMRLSPIESPALSTTSSVPGQADVHLTPGTEQQIGVQLAAVEKRDLLLPIRAAARVAYDPQLYSAVLEHQEAVGFRDQARGSESEASAASTVRASRLRLKQLGLSDEQIAAVARPGYDPSGLLSGGEGRIWVYADVPDSQVGLVRPGQIAELTSPALPGRVFKGTVKGIDSLVNTESRTVRVRVSIPNSGGELRSGMYLSVVIQASLGKALAVPSSAVVDTGTRQLAYVQSAPGVYQPRPVRVGRQAGDYTEIQEGLNEGEKVVSSANFLIDSESRIQAAAQEAQPQ
jgi:Cu(I)/Ag(I) efflux system membrane fusion protein